MKPGEWKAEAARLASEKGRLYSEMRELRAEARKAEAVMLCVEQAMRKGQIRKQVKSWDMEL